MNKKVGIILPTNEPEVFLRMFLPSIGNLGELRDMAQFQIIFQPPWDERRIGMVNAAMRSFGWSMLWDLVPTQEEPVNILDLRSKAAELDTTVKIYLSLDDDMRFQSGTKTVKKTSGQRYFEAIEYMRVHERCGGMDCRGFFGGKPQGQQIRPVWDWCFTMGVGMLFRNFTDIGGFALTPPEARHLRGNWDECLNSVVRIERGYFHALLRNCPTYHQTGPVDINYTVPDNHWQNKKVGLANTIGWIRERYGFPGWDSIAKIKKCPVLYEVYLVNGGIDFLHDEEVLGSLTMET